jgi:hypothetical protein
MSIKNILKIDYDVFWLTLIFCVIFGSLLLIFEKNNKSRTILPPLKNGKNLYHEGLLLKLTINKIDYIKQALETEVCLNDSTGKKQISVFLNFINEYSNRGSLYNVKVLLNEKKDDDVILANKPSQGFSVYTAKLSIPFDSKLMHFPFDDIPLGVGVEEDMHFSPGDNIMHLPISVLFLDNHDTGFILDNTDPSFEVRGDNAYYFFKLRRSDFTVYLTVLLFMLGLASSISVIKKSQSQSFDLSLLTYFIGLWGIRSIVLSGIQEPRPFPSYVDLAIITLFLFTLLGILFYQTKKRTSGPREIRDVVQ